MHTAAYLICFWFYQQLNHLDPGGGKYSERFWASVYAFVVLATLLFKPPILVFIGAGPRSISYVPDLATTYITVSPIEAILISFILGFLFYFTVQLGGLLRLGIIPKMVIVAVPGFFINTFVALFLIHSAM